MLEALVESGDRTRAMKIKQLAQELMRVETGASFIEGGAIVMPEKDGAEYRATSAPGFTPKED